MQVRVRIGNMAFYIGEQPIFSVGKREPSAYTYGVLPGWNDATDIPRTRLDENYEYIVSSIEHTRFFGPHGDSFKTLLIWELQEAVGDLGEW